MRRRSWILLLIIIAAALSLTFALRRTEPQYQGKTLSSWLQAFESESINARLQAAEAVRHIGTNALPFLISKLSKAGPNQEPKWKASLRSLLGKQSVFRITVPPFRSSRTQALAAIDALGPTASSAAPALENLLHENPLETRAILVLARLGADGIPPLTRALTNDEKTIRLGARLCLDMMESHSAILFPKTPQDAEFMLRNCQFNLLMLQAAFAEYKSKHPEPSQQQSDPMPRPQLPPDFQIPHQNSNTLRYGSPDSASADQ